jgi:hypothetical protein
MKECKRCGRCCKEEVCQLGEMAFGSISPPCPALINEGERYSCEFVKAEKMFFQEPKLAEALGVGKGCDAVLIAKEII